jgi:hypothetical protein
LHGVCDQGKFISAALFGRILAVASAFDIPAGILSIDFQ